MKPKQARAGVLETALCTLSLLIATGLPTLAHAASQSRSSSFEYTAQGLLSKEVIEPDQAQHCLQTSYTYDKFGNKDSATSQACAGASGDALKSAANPRSSSSISTYSPDGLTLTVVSTNALGQSETKIYDRKLGVLTELTGPNKLITRWQYDGFGRKTQETRADGTSTTWAYKLCTEANTNCPTRIGETNLTLSWVAIEQSYAANKAINAPEKRQYYDSLNRVVRIQTPGFDGAAVASTLWQDTQYNNKGQVKFQSNLYASTQSAIWTKYTYDELGRVIEEERPDSNSKTGNATTTYTYNGLSTTVKNANGQTKTTVKNAQGQVASVTDALGNTITYTYDAVGNLAQTNAAGSITALQYNQRGQKIAMQDPAMGSWTYTYNIYGELVNQRDSLNQTTSLDYDALGRLTKRTEPDLVSEWAYDKKFDGGACGTGTGPGKDGTGKLCEAKANNGYKRTHTYDTLGRLASTATLLDNPSIPSVVTESFDPNTGRIATKTWPTGYQVRYGYTPLGYLKSVTGGGTGGFTQTASYQILEMNAQGQITKYQTGNNVTTVKNFATDTGRLNSQVATTNGQASGNVINQNYGYDTLGNLTKRNDDVPTVNTKENFSYDSLNRLTWATISGGAVGSASHTQVMYDARGNISYKSDVGSYSYDAARPNRMTNVTLNRPSEASAEALFTGTRILSYAFDDTRAGAQSVNGTTVGNGNLWYTVSQDSANGKHNVRWESYTSFNMPVELKFGSLLDINNPTNTVADRTLSFVYGPEHQRIKQNVTLTSNGTSSYFAGNTWYLNGDDSLGLTYEKEVRANGTIENKHYLTAPGLTFAVFTSRTGTLNGLPATTTSYFNHDQLGSISAITDENGVVTERLAYDPWGKRRFINSTPGVMDKLDAIVGIKTDRGYTEHEHLDEMGVIHMNGRIFDPLMGRFMSADPFIQAPGELQSYNRYSYVMNNPLTMSDPSGYFWGWVVAAVAEVAHQTGIISEQQARTVQAIAIGYEMGLWGKAVTGSAISGGAIGGAASGFVGSNGNLQATAHGAFTGAMFGWAGGQGDPRDFARYAAHAGAGCVSSVAAQGNCGSGAASAVLGKFATNVTNGKGFAAEFSAAIVSGGVGSVIAGGKFENGATTAAYGYLFNEMLTRANGEKYKSSGRMYRGDVSLSDGLAMSPQMGKEFYGVVNDGLDICGIAHPLCRQAGAVMDYTEGFINITANGNGNKLASTALGDGSAKVLETTLNTAMKAPGAARLPGKLIDGLVHVQATATSKAFEAHDIK